MHGCQWHKVKWIKSYFREYGELWKMIWDTSLLSQVVLISSIKLILKYCISWSSVTLQRSTIKSSIGCIELLVGRSTETVDRIWTHHFDINVTRTKILFWVTFFGSMLKNGPLTFLFCSNVRILYQRQNNSKSSGEEFKFPGNTLFLVFT